MSRSAVSLILVFMITMAIACRKEDVTELPPKGILIDLMTELYIAESPLARVPVSVRDSVGMDVRRRIAMSFDMDPDELERIVAAVQTDVDLHIEICDSVLVRLEERENELKKKD